MSVKMCVCVRACVVEAAAAAAVVVRCSHELHMPKSPENSISNPNTIYNLVLIVAILYYPVKDSRAQQIYWFGGVRMVRNGGVISKIMLLPGQMIDCQITERVDICHYYTAFNLLLLFVLCGKVRKETHRFMFIISFFIFCSVLCEYCSRYIRILICN
jgi:hypothetical protein